MPTPLQGLAGLTKREPGSRATSTGLSILLRPKPPSSRITTAKLCPWRNEGRSLNVSSQCSFVLLGSGAAGIDRLRPPCRGPTTARKRRRPVKEEDGKYFDADGNPTFKIQDDGTVDWYTFSGYRRYHSDCHVCHGPDGVGSSYAPALADSLKTIDYATFLSIVAARPQECRRRQGKRHACLWRQQERLLLPRRSLRLSARARRRRNSARQAAEERGQAASRQGRTKRPAWVDEMIARRCIAATRRAAVLGAFACCRRPPARRVPASARPANWSTPTYCASAPTRRTCRSPTRTAQASKTSWPSWLPRRPVASRSPTPGIPMVTGLRAQHAARQSLRHHHGLCRRATNWCRTPMPTIAPAMCSCYKKGGGLDGVETIEDPQARRQADRRRRRHAADGQHGGQQADAAPPRSTR